MSEIGRSGKERRGSRDRRRGLERRQLAMPVPVERRIGFDRRSFRDRRSQSSRRGPGSAQVIWAPTAPSRPQTPAEAPPFAQRLWDMAHVELTEAEAERHWRAIARHRQILSDRVGRDVGNEVATLDYFLNVNPRLRKHTVIENAALAQIERNAMMDPLTGLFNRRFLESSLGREVERNRRHRVTSSLLMLDLDSFKSMNDRFGHGTGDLVLQALGEAILRRLRAIDLPCRYGGDEFAVVLPDTDRANARLAAERIRADVGRHFFGLPGRVDRLVLTVSVGVATYGAGCATVEALLDAADHALYQAKAAGGDRVIAAP